MDTNVTVANGQLTYRFQDERCKGSFVVGPAEVDWKITRAVAVEQIRVLDDGRQYEDPTLWQDALYRTWMLHTRTEWHVTKDGSPIEKSLDAVECDIPVDDIGDLSMGLTEHLYPHVYQRIKTAMEILQSAAGNADPSPEETSSDGTETSAETEKDGSSSRPKGTSRSKTS